MITPELLVGTNFSSQLMFHIVLPNYIVIFTLAQYEKRNHTKGTIEKGKLQKISIQEITT